MKQGICRGAAVLLALCLLAGASGCAKTPAASCFTFSTTATKLPYTANTTVKAELMTVAQMFFAAFETADYETMKTCCTASCVKEMFTHDAVFGMKTASLREVRGQEGENALPVTVDCEPAPGAAISGTDHTFYLVFAKTDGKWLIDTFCTGL